MSRGSLAIIIASFCTVFTGFAIRASYGILLPEMLTSLRISKTQAGLIYSSFFIAYTLFSPVLGLLADRINVRVLLTLFSAVLGIGTFLMGYSLLFSEACFFFALAGIGASASWSPVVALVQRWSSDKHRGTTLAFVDVGGSLGVAISGMIMPLIVMTYNWRMGWKGLGTLAFLMAGINFFLVRDYPVGKSNLENPKFSGRSDKPVSTMYVKILRDITFWLIGVSYLLIAFSVLIPFTFISTYAVQELMFPYDVATRLITVMAVSSIVGKLLLSSFSDALGRIKTIITCEMLIIIANLGIVFFHGSLAMHLCIAIFGFGQGAIWPLYAVCASDYFSRSSTGFIIGFWTLFFGVGSILSPIIAGWVADTTSKFMWSFMLATATATMSIFLLFPIKKEKLIDNVEACTH